MTIPKSLQFAPSCDFLALSRYAGDLGEGFEFLHANANVQADLLCEEIVRHAGTTPRPTYAGMGLHLVDQQRARRDVPLDVLFAYFQPATMAPE